MMNKVPSRRLAAIVSADIKGYSALMGIDEVGTLDALRDHRQRFIDPKINEYSGRIVKSTGDGLLLEFPSVVNAVQCCVELQSGMRTRNRDVPVDRQIIYRIGVNLGDVISEGDDIFGDGVNVAARLESIADPGGVCVSQAVADQLKGKLEIVLEDLGNRALKNIEIPVRVFRLKGAVAEPTRPDDKPSSPRSFNPHRPSLAILPFRNVGLNPEADFLAEGLALGIQTLLVQLSGIFFINACRNKRYLNGEATAAEIGCELSVQYVLEGSVQRFGTRVRVTPQLTDLETGATIWASRFDQDLEDLFELQDEITRKVVTALSSEILGSHYDRIWTSHLKQPGGWELYLRGISHHYKFSPQDNVRAREMFEELHVLVPDSSIPIGNIARSHWADFEGRWSKDPAKSFRLAAEWAEKAIAIEDDNTGIAHAILGSIRILERQFDDGLALCQKSAAYRSSCPFALERLAIAQIYTGTSGQAVKTARDALAVRSLYPASLVDVLAVAQRDHGDILSSTVTAQEAVRLAPDHLDALVTLCTDYALAGDIEEAQKAADHVLAAKPNFTISDYSNSKPYRDKVTLDRLAQALASTGLPP